jgi:hypothetical protein
MMLDAYDPAAHDVSRLRFWLTAGAPVPAVLVTEAAARFSGCRIVPAYGSSEVMMATVCTPDDPIERVVSSDGRPVPGVELRIVADGADAPADVEGEIRYRGPGRLVEYWGRPDLTAAALDERGWWRTGDAGRLDETGYLRVTGRIKDIIIRGGFNISAREVEDALLGVPAVKTAAVIGPTRWSVSGSARSLSWPRARTRRPWPACVTTSPATAAWPSGRSPRGSRSPTRGRSPRPARSGNTCCATPCAPATVRPSADHEADGRRLITRVFEHTISNKYGQAKRHWRDYAVAVTTLREI